MTAHKFTLECKKVQQLDFVDNVDSAGKQPLVFVELSRDLAAVLPQYLAFMGFKKEDFSVKQVINRFERDIVEHLINATLIAQAQLRSAKAQAEQG